MMTVSVPGKVHLIGEHAVVYGEPAILAAVGLRTLVAAKKHKTVVLRHQNFGFAGEWTVEEATQAAQKAHALWEEGRQKGDFSAVFAHVKDADFAKVILGNALDRLGIGGGISVEVASALPIGSGLGSSASVALALTKGVAEAYGKRLSEERLNELAYEAEKFKHGLPSGGDNTACCYGGLVWFRKGNPTNEIVSLREEIPYSLENFVLVYTRKPAKTTGELVQMVKSMDPAVRDPHVKKLGALAHEMRGVLKAQRFSRMKEIINETNGHLTALGLSIPETEQVTRAVTAIGGAAKMCGACYGGVMLCYHEDQDRLAEAIRSAGFEPWKAELAVEGVRVEHHA